MQVEEQRQSVPRQTFDELSMLLYAAGWQLQHQPAEKAETTATLPTRCFRRRSWCSRKPQLTTKCARPPQDSPWHRTKALLLPSHAPKAPVLTHHDQPPAG